jgi:Flp pilus assembly protein TadG
MLKQVVPFRSFFGNEEGSILQIFALSIVLVCGTMGLAIDGGRAMSASNKASAALDAAALAAARTLIQTGASEAELLGIAKQYFDTNTTQGAGLVAQYDNVQLEVNLGSKTIRVSADVKVKTTFGRVIGYETFNFSKSAISSFNIKDIELGMALDLTGSMSGQKIEDLRVAAKNLIDTLLPDDGSVSNVKIGLAPYATAIRLPTALSAVASNDTSVTKCVRERATADRYSDAAPTAASYFKMPIQGEADIDGYEGFHRFDYNRLDVDNPSRDCPVAIAQGLTDDKDLLKDQISDYKADGYTAGHIGAQWAWNIISPNWAGLWPDSFEAKGYDQADLVKAVIFMTDGVFNTAYDNDTSKIQARALCDAMKEKNVIIYTVSFQNPNHPDLQYCASTDATSGELLYFEASNGAALNAAFQKIAFKLTNLRLSK